MQEEPAPLLHVYAFGPFELAWHTVPWTAEAIWESRTSARTLFKLLLCAPGRQAPKSLLAGILWPEVDEERARESLRSACKVLRAVLRTGGGEELIAQRSADDILSLADQTRLWVDADAFEDLVAQASRAESPEAAQIRWEAARTLLRGEFFAGDQSAEWMRHRMVTRRQQRLWLARCRLTRHLADLYIQRGQTSLAEEILEAHLLRFPTDQDALYRFLLLLEQQGYFEQASILYERTRHALEARGKQPAQHVRLLYDRFQQSVSSGKPALSARAAITISPVAPAFISGNPGSSETRLTEMAGPLSSLPAPAGPSENVLSALRALLTEEGREDMSLLSRRQLLELGIATFITRLARLDSKHISAVEREELGRALGQSIADGWKLFHTAGSAEVLTVSQLQLALVHQAHPFLSSSIRPYLYTGAYGAVGLALHHQDRHEESLHAYHHAHLAAIATGDPWYIACNLICQANTYQALGRLVEAIQSLEEAFGYLGQTEEEHRRTRAHILGCWADVAIMMNDFDTARQKLDAITVFLDHLGLHEEFDLLSWYGLNGKYAHATGDYPAAVQWCEQALNELPEQWVLRQTLVLMPLISTYIAMHDRDASLITVEKAAQVVPILNAPLMNKSVIDALQGLLTVFPRDTKVKTVVSGLLDQIRPNSQERSLQNRD